MGFSQEQPPSLCSFQSLLLLVVLPYLDIVRMSYMYTAVPLYWIDSMWPYWQLGLMLSLFYVPFRMIGTALLRPLGDWWCVPCTAIGAASSLLMAVRPGCRFCVMVGCIGNSMCVMVHTAHRTLVHRRFGQWPTQQVRAMRLLTFWDTFGYSCGALIGGVLYDLGGFGVAAWFQFLIIFVECLGTATLLPVHDSFREFIARLSSQKVPSQTELPAANIGNVMSEVAPRSQPCQEVPANSKMAGTWMMGCMCIFASSCNLYVYALEWTLYAVYFREVHHWSGIWTGFAQMLGDLIAAGILALSALRCGSLKTKSPSVGPRGVTFKNLLSPPFGVGWLLMLHGVLMVMLAQPNFTIALIGQIVMGTVYVFIEQGVQELFSFYACGNNNIFKEFVANNYLSFNVAAFACGLFGFVLYEYVSKLFPFYLAAGVAVLGSLTFNGYFAARMARAPSGILGGLARAEEHLLPPMVRRQSSTDSSTGFTPGL